MRAAFGLVALAGVAMGTACGGAEEEAAPGGGERPAAAAPEAAGEALVDPAAGVEAPPSLPKGLLLGLSPFEVTEEGKVLPNPQPAELLILVREDGAWKHTTVSDPDSNVFHKALVYEPAGQEPAVLTLGGSAAALKLWRLDGEGALRPEETVWEKDFGGKFSRMRDAEVADLDGDGDEDVAVATHDQGVVAVVRSGPEGFEVEEIDQEADTFVHEIEIGDLDGDGVPEVYATPSEPNRLDGTPQSGKVVRYVPGKGEGRVVAADLGDRHAKEILVGDVDGDGSDELYVAVEGHMEDGRLTEPVEILRYEAGTDPAAGAVIATLDDRLTRFLTAGDVDGDGQAELVAAAFRAGLWLLEPGDDPNAEWQARLIDADSSGFEHASLAADLDADGTDELYVASDDQGEVRRYVWTGDAFAREVIYRREVPGSAFTWNLMPVPTELVPAID